MKFSQTLKGITNMGSFWQSKTKLDPADILFSRHIRKRDGWKCQYKFKCNGAINYEQIGDTGSLTNSHFQKRGKRSVRFDEENCDAACRPCHAYVEDTVLGKRDLEDWKRNQLGEQRFKALLVRANTPRRMDRKLELMYVKELVRVKK